MEINKYMTGLLLIILILTIYLIYNLFTKVEKQENTIIIQNNYIESISNLIEESNKVLSSSRLSEAFSSDDEVGVFFTNIKLIQENLNNFIIK